MHKYDPLDSDQKEIRLLVLQPGSGDSILCCTLIHAFLDTWPPPAYETISYVCGDQAIKAAINLHGSEVQVPATSEAALRRMRRKDKPRTLWIDSICIDERNVAERGRQVGIMYEIYTRTCHNCIYLGPDNGSTPKVVTVMEAMLHELSVVSPDYPDWYHMPFEYSRIHRLPDLPLSIDFAQSGLMEFFENPWFTRLWIVQEASLGRISTCYKGQSHVSLADVLLVAQWLMRRSDQLPSKSVAQIYGMLRAGRIFTSADRLYGRRRQVDAGSRRHHSLWNFLGLFAQFDTSDRRDQVFALMALWQMHNRASDLPAILKPDYSLSVSQVFTNASRHTIRETDDLSLLLKVCASSLGKEGDHPSWVPLADRDELDERFPSRLLLPSFQADDVLRVDLSSSNNGSNTLDVGGVFIDEVTEVDITTSHDPEEIAMKHMLESMESRRPMSSWVKDLGADTEVRVGLVLQAGQSAEDWRAAATEEDALHGYQSFKRYLKDHESLPPELPPFNLESTVPDEDMIAARYCDTLRKHVKHRAVFYTKDGHMGLGPECTQSGDILAVLYGCSYPVVMRPLPTPGEYTFLECAYVYGIMRGEAVRRHNELGREDDRFQII
jgi:hypothetical protein